MRLCLLLLFPIISLQSGDLSPFIRPTRYDLIFDTDFNSWTYSGSVNIQFDVLKQSHEIRLHASETVNISELTVQGVSLNHPLAYLTSRATSLLYGTWKLNYKCKPCSSHRWNTAKDLLIIKLGSALPPGHYVIKSLFSGTVSSKLTGYYRTGYTLAHGGGYVNMASTHLSPDKARTVFPSFDEPQFRAVFSLTVIHPNNLIATSNMPVSKEVLLADGRKSTKFEDTPGMSTYLLAWVQHNFVFEERIIEGVRMRHYARPAYRSVIAEKIEIVGKSVKFYNDFFKIPFPLPKLDTIGIPNYLVGGMENWGLITLTENAALSRPRQRFGSGEIDFRNLLAHEVSHMWFGNLVTMYWWDDLWLKEGMASYLSYPCADSLYDDVKMMDQFMINNWQKAMFADDIITSHPVQMPIHVTSQITQIFDSITYKKGATVLAMMRDVMGEEGFKSGMTHFLNTYKYSTARYRDLLTSMTRYCNNGAELRLFMNSFILQKNYPLIELQILSDKQIRLVQSRYVRDSGMIIKNDISPFNYSWYIPITIVTDSMSYTADKHIMMKEKEMVLTLSKPFKWIKLNSEGKHMYVTHYSSSNLDKTLEVVRENTLDPSLGTMNHRDRAHVICDIFSAAQVKLVPYSTAFEAAKCLREEQHYLPWTLIYKYFKTIRSMIDESWADCYRKYIVYLLLPQYKATKGSKETLVEQLKFEIFMKYARYIRGERKPTIYDGKDLSELVSQYKASAPQERADMDLLVQTSDGAEIELIGNTLLQYPSTSVSVIINFISYYSSVAPDVVWHVYRDNYQVYNDKYGLAQFEYANALKTMVKRQRNSQTIAEIEGFFKDHTAGAGYLGLQNGLEEAKFVSKFKQESEPELKRYLEGQRFCQDE
ncbi:aminopeptidase Ey-like [Bolinopsis microptera]|uniref:aminopeptidase Ey-like n=1 Tax=Bolinopsis microptera TaxID=2820187 RepID=UPI00307AC5AB